MEFELRKGRVDDWTDREEYDLLYNQLSDHWKMQIAKEEKTRQKQQFWVKITNLDDRVEVVELQNFLQSGGIGMVKEIQKIPNGFLVDCGNLERRGKIMNLNEVEVDHRVIKVSFGERGMTGDQIFDFVQGLLQLQEEVKGVPPPPPK